MPTITDVTVQDIRVPTSDELLGSDPFHKKPDYSAVLTTITSSSGKRGISVVFTCGAGNDWVVYAIDQLVPLVKNTTLDSFIKDPGELYQTILNHHQLRWLGDGVFRMAMGGVMNAMWDLWAQEVEKPMWKLLVDLEPEIIINCIDWRHLEDGISKQEALEILKQHHSQKSTSEERLKETGVKAYSTAGWLGLTDDQILDKINKMKEDGFDAFKLKVGQDLDFDKTRIQFIRNAIGLEAKLMVDANQFWGVDEAITYMTELADFDITWIEEPTARDDVMGFKRISKALNPLGLKVAAGEQIQSPVIFKQMISSGAIQFAQIDACRMGGVNDVMAVILLASKYDVPVCPHGGGIGLCNMIRHLAIWDQVSVAGHSNTQWVEYIDFLQEGVFEIPVEISNGAYVLPTNSGWGLEVDRKFLNEHLYPIGSVWRERDKPSDVTFIAE
jgi:L-fuconate dehydratase